MKAYHIDVRGCLTKKNIKTVTLSRIPYEWENHSILKERYPTGISTWGKTILGMQNQFEFKTLNLGHKEGNNPYYWNSYLIDILYEYERLISFPDKLSRLECMFASKTIEDARAWKNFLGIPNAKIYEIDWDHGNFLELDAQYLNTDIGAFSLPFTQNNAYHYWKGHRHKDGFARMELLIKPPISVVRLIE